MRPATLMFRSGLSLLLALVIHGLIVLLVFVLSRWQWSETVEPLKEITSMMTLITTVPVQQEAVSVPELSSSAPVQKQVNVKHVPVPAAPRKANRDRKAHKAVALTPQPSVPASIADQIVVAPPAAAQQPEITSTVVAMTHQQLSETQPVASSSLFASAMKDLAAAYRAMVHGRIAALQRYPVLAKRMGEEGTVLVRFTILASGKISHVVVMESSGSERLDVAAVEIFTQGLNGQLPPIPAELNKGEWTLSLPIRYQLQ